MDLQTLILPITPGVINQLIRYLSYPWIFLDIEGVPYSYSWNFKSTDISADIINDKSIVSVHKDPYGPSCIQYIERMHSMLLSSGALSFNVFSSIQCNGNLQSGSPSIYPARKNSPLPPCASYNVVKNTRMLNLVFFCRESWAYRPYEHTTRN